MQMSLRIKHYLSCSLASYDLIDFLATFFVGSVVIRSPDITDSEYEHVTDHKVAKPLIFHARKNSHGLQ